MCRLNEDNCSQATGRFEESQESPKLKAFVITARDCAAVPAEAVDCAFARSETSLESQEQRTANCLSSFMRTPRHRHAMPV